MGLLATLGLHRRQAPVPGGPGTGQPPGRMPVPPVDARSGVDASGGDATDGAGDPVVAELDAIEQLLAGIADEKAKAGLVAELATLRANHEKGQDVADPTKRDAAAKAAAAAAKKLHERAQKLADADAEKRSVSDAKADLDAVVKEIETLAAGIGDAAAKKRIDGELAKLKLAVAKAKQPAPAAVAEKALAAVTTAAQALRLRADQTKDAVDWAAANLKPLDAAAAAAIAALAGTAKGVLQKELDALRAAIAKHLLDGDRAALQSTDGPRLQRVHGLATGLPKIGAQADQDLAQAAQAVAALDAELGPPLQAKLKALQDKRAAAWPAGNTLEALEGSVGEIGNGAKALLGECAEAQAQMGVKKDIAALQAQLDALQPRIDKANESPVPPYVDLRQGNVRNLAQTLRAQLAARKKAPAEATLQSLRLALDDMERFKGLGAAFQAKLDAAKNGPIKAALAVKLVPPGLAAARDKTIREGETEILAMTADGLFGPAEARIPQWVTEAKAWAGAKKAYDSLRSKDPSTGPLEDLAEAPGGGPVLDALVADLPDDIPQKVLTTAVKARFGIKLKQFDHRDGKGADPKADAKALNPNLPDKDLKGLYKILGKVPMKDVRNIEKMERFVQESGGASYSPGVFNDTIKLYCGRPDDGNTQDFNIPGEVVPRGQKVQPGCEPVNTATAMPYFDFATLHEVGHGVDDAQKIMKGPRKDDAGWDSHGTGHISKVAAKHFGYDADYIEDMLDSKTNAPPKKKPKPPKGVKEADWEAARVKVEDWARQIRTDFGPWWKADAAAATAIDGRVYQEAYEGDWVSYRYSARAQGITGYQFRSPMEWFAELYAAFHTQRLNPKHPATSWLARLKAKSLAK